MRARRNTTCLISCLIRSVFFFASINLVSKILNASRYFFLFKIAICSCVFVSGNASWHWEYIISFLIYIYLHTLTCIYKLSSSTHFCFPTKPPKRVFIYDLPWILVFWFGTFLWCRVSTFESFRCFFFSLPRILRTALFSGPLKVSRHKFVSDISRSQHGLWYFSFSNRSRNVFSISLHNYYDRLPPKFRTM